jgi:outer membrane protein
MKLHLKQLIERVDLHPRGVGAVLLSLWLVTAQGSAQVVSVDRPVVHRDESTAQRTPAIQELPRVGVDETRPFALTLFDAVKMALSNNREIEVERLNVSQAQYDLFAAEGTRDINLTANSFYEHRTIPIGSVLGGGPDGSLTTETVSYDVITQQLLPTGAQWLAQITNARVDTNNLFAALNPQYSTALNIQIRQPLMRSFSIDDSRRRIRVARRRLDLSDTQFRQKAIDIVSRVQRSYWDLVFALRDAQIRRESVDLARTQLEHNRRMVNEGTLAPIDLVSVEVELDKRREAVLLAVETVTRAENVLKQLIFAERTDHQWGQPLIPTDAAELRSMSFSLNEVEAIALSNRAELAQNALQQQINRIDERFFENQTRPQVDLTASYTASGLSGSLSRATNPFGTTTNLLLDRVNQLSAVAGLPPVDPGPPAVLPEFLLGGYGQSLHNLLSNDFRTFRFGLTFSFPLRNRTAEAQLGYTLAEGKKIDSQRRALEQRVEAEVRDALQSVETARERVTTTRASREAAEKQSESEQRRFDAGLSITYFVLERQNALSEARGRELKALTDYNKALSELQRVMGTTLSYANVELAPASQK